MSIGLRLTVADDSMYRDTWDKFMSLLENVGEAFQNAAIDLVHRTIEEAFEAEDTSGLPWAPLAVATVKERVRLGYGGAHPILVREGTLESSLINSDDPRQILDIQESGGDRSVRIGSDDPRFGWHQEGTGHIPARPMWPEGLGERRFVSRLTTKFIGIIESMQ